MWNRTANEFEFRPGGVFANVVLADEINRASPKTQSALLEAMEERQVTVDAHTYRLPRPFMVIATQNPIELEGTYPLPEAQLDRFLMRIPMGYPHRDAELAILEAQGERVGDGRRPRARRERGRRRRRGRARRHACTSHPSSATTSSTSSPRRAVIPTSCSARARAARSSLQRAARALAASFGRDVRDPRRREARAPRGARAPPAARARRAAAGRHRATTSCAAILASVPVPGATGG